MQTGSPDVNPGNGNGNEKFGGPRSLKYPGKVSLERGATLMGILRSYYLYE